MQKGWPTKTLGEVRAFVRGPFGGSLLLREFSARSGYTKSRRPTENSRCIWAQTEPGTKAAGVDG
jgi:hypothetical protein